MLAKFLFLYSIYKFHLYIYCFQQRWVASVYFSKYINPLHANLDYRGCVKYFSELKKKWNLIFITIDIQHEKCIQMSTNKPSIGPVILEIALEFWGRFVKYQFFYSSVKRLKQTSFSRSCQFTKVHKKYYEAMTWWKFHFHRSISSTVNILLFLGRFYHNIKHLSGAYTFSKIQNHSLHNFQMCLRGRCISFARVRIRSSGLGLCLLVSFNRIPTEFQ